HEIRQAALACLRLTDNDDVQITSSSQQQAGAGLRNFWWADSRHNTLLVTERCDQLSVMCSQPPKKQHTDLFPLLKQACLLAPKGATIGFSGGEPTLYQLAKMLLMHGHQRELPQRHCK